MARRLIDDEKRTPARYDIGTSYIYVGYADYDLDANVPAEASPAWTIRRITLTAGSPTASEWTKPGAGTWDDRATESYT